MRARVARLALVLLAAAASACSVDEPNPASSVPAGAREDATLTGRIVDLEGVPVAGAPVVVLRDRTGAAALTAIFSLGIACVASPGSCDGTAKPAAAGTTDAEGRYALTLPGAYRPGYETDDDWTLQVGRAPTAGEDTGPSSSFQLEVSTKVEEAPDLVLWDAAPTITGRELLEVHVPDGQARFVDDEGAVLWAVEGRTVDPRVLEDTSSRLVGVATADEEVTHRDGRTIYHQAMASAAVRHVGTAVPLSRAKPCTGGTLGCPFTDGDLAAEQPLDGPATVDLGRSTAVGLVVVRGRGEARVEGSTDGRRWTGLPARELVGAPGWSAAPRTAASFRYVRVTGPDRLAEVSVWPPTAAERAAAARAGGPGRTVPIAVAALLVLLVGAAALRLRRR